MKQETVLEVLSHALRWSNNSITELTGNHVKSLSPALSNSLRNLSLAFQECIEAVHQEQSLMDSSHKRFAVWVQKSCEDEPILMESDAPFSNIILRRGYVVKGDPVSKLRLDEMCYITWEGTKYQVQRVK